MDKKEILKKAKQLLNEIDKMDLDDKVDILNNLKDELKKISPFNDPVNSVKWVKSEDVYANEYNPNKVAPPEMKLLELSILEDGYTQPIVVYPDKENERYIVVDGFHRNRIGKESKQVKKRIHGYLPIVIIDKEINERMASTIRHNRARGTHGIEPMSKIVEEMYFRGWSDKKIAEQLGMDKDELLRLKQFTGLGDLFKDRNFSMSWE